MSFSVQSVTQYTNLIPRANANKPRFNSVVGTWVNPFVQTQISASSIALTYDIDTAIGVQLDAVGQWIGRSRVLDEPLTGVYFSFDTPGLGFDQGVWLGPEDPIDALVSLDDTSYRSLLYAYRAANSWNGTALQAQQVLNYIYPPGSGPFVFVHDHQDMSVTYGMSGALPNAVMIALFLQGYLPIKPGGVTVNWLVVSVPGTAMFGFDMNNSYIQGFDQGSWGVNAQGYYS